MIDVFRSSFYSLWFQNLPDQIIESAMNEVSGFSESLLILNSCPKIADEYLVLKTVAFLTTYMNVGGEFTLEFGEDEDKTEISMKGVSESGIQSFVKKDSIDSSLSREYHAPKVPDGYDVSDFPHGAIKERIDKLEATCKKANAFVGGVGSNRPLGHCGSKGANTKHAFPESDKCKVNCNGLGNRSLQKDAKTC